MNLTETNKAWWSRKSVSFCFRSSVTYTEAIGQNIRKMWVTSNYEIRLVYSSEVHLCSIYSVCLYIEISIILIVPSLNPASSWLLFGLNFIARTVPISHDLISSPLLVAQNRTPVPSELASILLSNDHWTSKTAESALTLNRGVTDEV